MRRYRQTTSAALLLLFSLGVTSLSGCGGGGAVTSEITRAISLAREADVNARQAVEAVNMGNLEDAQSFGSRANSLADRAQETAAEGSPSDQKAAGTAQADAAAVDAQVIALDAPTSVAGAEAEWRTVVRTMKRTLCALIASYEYGEPPPSVEQWTAAIATDLVDELGVSLDADVLQELIAQVAAQTNRPIEKLNALISFDPTNADWYIQAFGAFACATSASSR